MAAGSGQGLAARSLQQTPTWAVAIVCLVIIAISIVIEHLIHLIAKVGTYIFIINSSENYSTRNNDNCPN